MGLFSGLEKFGLKFSGNTDLYDEEQDHQNHKEEEKKEAEKKGEEKKEAEKKEVRIPTEDEFLFEKSVRCRVCDYLFKTKMVKNGRLKRLEPDKDLRPKFQYIDTLKYDITSCPVCGYTAMNRYFEHLSTGQAKLIKEQICSQFSKGTNEEPEIYTYDIAIDRYKLTLANDLVKRARASEKAYTCLKLSWVLRGKAAEMPENTPEEKAAKEECKKEEEDFYLQAYEGFLKAISQETFPMCGMEQNTVDYLLAQMSFHFKKYENASRFLAAVLSSQVASRRMKDMALDLKEEIITEMKSQHNK